MFYRVVFTGGGFFSLNPQVQIRSGKQWSAAIDIRSTKKVRMMMNAT